MTVVAPDGSGAAIAGADRIAGPLTQPQLATLYGESDVLLKLSRVEGMFGPPLEGFHRGATCVVTPVTGHDEYIVHGENGLVVDWDDTAGTARALDLLAARPRAAAPPALRRTGDGAVMALVGAAGAGDGGGAARSAPGAATRSAVARRGGSRAISRAR